MTVQRRPTFRWVRRAAILVAIPFLCEPAVAQQVVSGMVLPNGQVVSGPVFRRNGTTVPSITTGVESARLNRACQRSRPASKDSMSKPS